MDQWSVGVRIVGEVLGVAWSAPAVAAAAAVAVVLLMMRMSHDLVAFMMFALRKQFLE